MKEPVSILFRPELENASLIIGWEEDSGNLGPGVIAYLNRHIGGRRFCEIEPENFYPLNGVEIENNIARFPSSRFYAGSRKELVIFESSQPAQERYSFLNVVLDVGQYYCNVSEIYIISGAVTQVAHTTPRRLMAVFNKAEIQERLRSYELENMTWEGPPAINSYLLWLAQKRGIAGVSIWPEVSFYLAAAEDLKAIKSVLYFLDRRFDLGLDFGELDSRIRAQSEKLALLRKENSRIDRYIRTLEYGLSLSEEEQLNLVRDVAVFLGRTEA